MCEFFESGLGIAVCVNPYCAHTGLYNHKPSNICFEEVQIGAKGRSVHEIQEDNVEHVCVGRTDDPGALRRLAICLRPDCYCLVCLLAVGMQDAIQLCSLTFGRSAVIHIEMYAQLYTHGI